MAFRGEREKRHIPLGEKGREERGRRLCLIKDGRWKIVLRVQVKEEFDCMEGGNGPEVICSTSRLR